MQNYSSLVRVYGDVWKVYRIGTLKECLEDRDEAWKQRVFVKIVPSNPSWARWDVLTTGMLHEEG